MQTSSGIIEKRCTNTANRLRQTPRSDYNVGMKTLSIDDDVRTVLERSEITDSTLTLPQQLSRDLYVRVDKVIKAAGGKWNRGQRCHIFGTDPRRVLGLAIETGGIVNQQQAYQEFMTPKWLADRMCTDVFEGHRVLEPSAGTGNIAKAAACCGAHVVCVELQEKFCDVLREDDRLIVRPAGDFLKLSPSTLQPFDFVLMNPPFANGQEYQHVRHAFDFLKSGGILRSVMSPSLTFRSQRRDIEFREWFDTLGGQIEELPAGAFKESGTLVNTVLVEIRRDEC